jgi:hypothetical protein
MVLLQSGRHHNLVLFRTRREPVLTTRIIGPYRIRRIESYVLPVASCLA